MPMPHLSPRPPAEGYDFELRIPPNLITYTHSNGTKFADITEELRDLAAASRVKEGFIILKSNGKKFAVVIQEARQFVEQDLMNRLNAYEAHGNSTQLLQHYHALPVKGGALNLGKYQSILAVLRNGCRKPEVSVVPVSGKLETRLIDTGGKDELTLTYERNPSNYEKRGSERIFDITELINDAVRRLGIEPSVIYAGTGNTTCVLYHDINGEGVDGLVRRMDAFAPPHLPAGVYAHNNLSARVNIPKDERRNGRAHVLAAILNSSLLFPDSGLRSMVYLVELDGPRRERTLHVGVAKKATYNEIMKLLE